MENPTYTFTHRGFNVEVFVYNLEKDGIVRVVRIYNGNVPLIFEARTEDSMHSTLDRMIDIIIRRQKNAVTHSESFAESKYKGKILEYKVKHLSKGNKKTVYTYHLN